MERTGSVVAWVESPLQLVGAAEWAAAHERRVPIAGRLTAQMSETADELISRDAQFGATDPYLGIPWRLLSAHHHWLVGDGFSGQFRLAAAVLRPRRLTFLDDGANASAFAAGLLGTAPYARPGVAEHGLTTRVAPIARDQILGRALAGQVAFFTAFDFGGELSNGLRDLGVRIERHRFEWTRRTARPFDAPSGRVMLGSARPVDGRMPLGEYLAWVEGEAALGPLTYLPHRREPEAVLDAVRRVPGVTLQRMNLPVELVLAGAARPLEILTLPSSTTTTLPLVLEGTGVSVRSNGDRDTRGGSR